jgi:predicted RNase H-like HicB family nuclease
MATKSRYYVERTDDGRYAVRRESSNRASGVFGTQREAIERAKELDPHGAPVVERFRDTRGEGSLSIRPARRTATAPSERNVGRSAMRFYSFQIVIEKEPEDEGYYAYSPTLPGCFSNGKTIEAARRNIREAIEQHMASLMAHTQPIPQDDRLVHVEELTVGVPE